MKACATCGKTLYRTNKSGFCQPCFWKSDDGRALTRRAIDGSTAARLRPTISERLARFRIRLSDSECWGWTGAHNGVGYGVMTVHSRVRLATHLALEEVGLPRPSTQHVACHSCDNPACTNPAHLWWGTEKENMQDASRKGRLSGRRRKHDARNGIAA